MIRPQRRSARASAQKANDPSPPSKIQSKTPSKTDRVDLDAVREQEDLEESCPACKPDVTADPQGAKESWIGCDACKAWFHWRCAGNGEDMELINKWYCESCLSEDITRSISLKLPARKSSRKHTKQDYANLNSGLQSDPQRWLRLLDGKVVTEGRFKRMKGSEVGLEWLNDDTAMREPIVIESPEGLGMKMPPSDFTVKDVAESVGADTSIEVIDVASQANSPGWTLGKWAEYYTTEPSQRDKIRNVISLEISGTKLADQVLPPRVVRELDWVEKFWPAKSKGKGQYPKVQLYCLMGVANAYTDWHIDFAGSSVYYHVLRGSKIFYFIRPTPANLAAYERWSGSEIQTLTWLGDMVDEVTKVTLHAGNTMIIPTGWIHAVYTPVDALVFGGNFLHSYNVATQLRVREIELATSVPKKFRFPLFSKLCWYAGERYLRDLRGKEEFSQRVLKGIEALACFLVSQVRIIERGSENAKRDAKDEIPTDRVKDPAALARELRWRARQAGGYDSDGEELAMKDSKGTLNGNVTNGEIGKRKFAQLEGGEEPNAQGNKRNFKPRLWDAVAEQPIEPERRVLKARKPDGQDGWKTSWVEWGDGVAEPIEGEDVAVTQRRNLIIKVRRTLNGLERQRVERVVEEWIWKDDSSSSSSGDGSRQAEGQTGSTDGMDVGP